MEAFWGVLIGAAVTLATNFLTHIYTLKKEEKQFELQQIAEKEKRQYEKDQIENENKLKEISLRKVFYQNSLNSLSGIVTAKNQAISLSDEEKLKRSEDALSWLNHLLLITTEISPNIRTSFVNTVNHFRGNPEKYASDLISIVSELYRRDEIIFPKTSQQMLEPIQEEIRKPDIVDVNFYIDSDFRRQHLITTGETLPSSHKLNCKLTDFTESQRSFLVEVYSGSYGLVPNDIKLVIPEFDKDLMVVNKVHPGWNARLNPLNTPQEDIFKFWESDYNNAREEAKNKLKLIIGKGS